MVEQSLVVVDDDNDYVKVQFTPTIPHCSMATLIGLAIRVQLLRSLPDRFKVLNVLCRCLKPAAHYYSFFSTPISCVDEIKERMPDIFI